MQGGGGAFRGSILHRTEGRAAVGKDGRRFGRKASPPAPTWILADLQHQVAVTRTAASSNRRWNTGPRKPRPRICRVEE